MTATKKTACYSQIHHATWGHMGNHQVSWVVEGKERTDGKSLYFGGMKWARSREQGYNWVV